MNFALSIEKITIILSGQTDPCCLIPTARMVENEDYDPAAPAPDVHTTDDILRLLSVANHTGALLPPVNVVGQFLSLPPYNDIYELAWCPDRGRSDPGSLFGVSGSASN